MYPYTFIALVLESIYATAMVSSVPAHSVIDLEAQVSKVAVASIDDQSPQTAIETKDQFSSPESSSPIAEVRALEQWNEPRINIYRYLATLYTFVTMGMNDGAIGVSAIYPISTIT